MKLLLGLQNIWGLHYFCRAGHPEEFRLTLPPTIQTFGNNFNNFLYIIRFTIATLKENVFDTISGQESGAF
jgi:hypothetical protein